MPRRTAVRLFRTVALLEGLSWLGLLVGMYVKYVAQTSEQGVHVFGPIHGGVFVAYVALTLVTGRLQRWSSWTMLTGLAASIPPFGTVLFDLWAKRTGRLAQPRQGRAADPEPALDSTP